ncbi:MAG: glycosyltransferase [bacterium]|nr:glycosyltransferase [bacterium]
MKVAQLSTMDIKGGGGSMAAYRLHTALRANNVDSSLLVKFKYSDDKNVIGKHPTNELVRKISSFSSFMDEIPGKFSNSPDTVYRSSAWYPDGVARKLKELNPDVINLHWINGGFVRLESLAKWQGSIVWTMHDMWAFCGTEHYTSDQRYQEGYLKTNRPAGESGFDVNRWTWQRKQKAWSTLTDLVVVTPSKWLASCVRKSVLFKNYRIEVIPNSVNQEIFKPQEKIVLRKKHNINPQSKLILFGAGNTASPRKGVDLLKKALKKLSVNATHNYIELVVFGKYQPEDYSDINLPIKHLGHVAGESEIAEIYSMADVFVAPSRQDNLPNTIVEALACGTPCVAFNIGGMPDMIDHQNNGYLAKAFDVDELAAGIVWVLEDKERWQKLSSQSRIKAENNYTYSEQAKKYSELYQSITV